MSRPRLALTLGLLAATALVPVLPAAAQDSPIQPRTHATPLADFSGLVKQVKPAVVSITSKMREGGDEQGMGQGGGQQFGQSPFGQNFPFPFPFQFGTPQRPHLIEARGSGFIVDPNGTVVTNNHVVKNARSVTVTLEDGTVLPAKVLGTDPRTDVAVLKVSAKRRLPFIELGDSSQVDPGQWVVAVGNPFGLGGTVTAGIVSARGRDIGEGPYDSFLQIDAPINQGNSGGPLFTQDGKVVGMNTAILSPSGGSVGIGFAIPSNTVKNVVAQLEKSGHVTRGYIGVRAQTVSANLAGALHLPQADTEDRGALVASVEPDSPASRAGVQPGDVIVGVNDQHVGNPRDLALDVSQTAPGSHASLTVVRKGAQQKLDVTIATLSDQGSSARGGSGGGDSGSGPSLGVALSPITPQLRGQLDLPDSTRGAVVTEVQPGSAAEQAGLQTGDVIVGVGERAVTSPAEASHAIRDQLRRNQAVALRIMRNGEPAFVAVSPQGGGDDDSGDGNG